MKKYYIFLAIFFWSFSYLQAQAQPPATLPYSQDFTTGNDFTFTGNQVNKWAYGTAAGNPGQSIYISNDNGVTNLYTNTSSSVDHAYRDFQIPAGSTMAMLTFDWRAFGESSFDYLRVWMVPATFTPILGTQITAGAGRIQIGGNLNQQSAWQTYFNQNLNISSFAGASMRLVFEWRNDGSLGTNPPSAIDNINFLIPTCFAPTPGTPTGVTSAAANLPFTLNSAIPANGYQYYISTSNVPPTATTTPTGTVASSPVPATGLTPNTTYYWWIRTVCSATDQSIWLPGASFTTGQIPAPMPYFQNFTGPNDFGFSGAQTNRWSYGSATGNPSNSIYVSNDNGTTNEYTNTAASVTHAYRDITVPTGTTLATLMFDWKAMGEGSSDYLRVWLVPISFMPTAGTQVTAGSGRIQVGGNLNQKTDWQTYFNQNVNLSSFATAANGNTVRLVFEWRNDGSVGTNPPAAVDNINLLVPTCQGPTPGTPNSITATSANLLWSGPSPVPANGFQYYYSTSNVAPTATTAPSGSSTTSPAAITGLTPNTTYYWWVRAVCSATNTSIWIPGASFITGQIPATMPYYQGFDGPNDFSTPGSQANRWFYGSAEGNPANSLYISNDNGVSNAYTNTAASVSHTYRDITVPAGTTLATLMFDWKAQGESSFDYLRVWTAPTSFMPTQGTQITTGSGRIQIGGNLNLKSDWQTYFNQNVNLSSYATAANGYTVRLIFEWRNDGSGGTNPPGAIDNINLAQSNCRVPTSGFSSSGITATTANIAWTQASPVPSNGYQYYLAVGNVPPTPTSTPFGTTNTPNAALSGLTPNTTYYWWVRSNCGGSGTSFWYPGGFFTTSQIPATIPYVQDFTSGNDFGFINGSQVNKWVHGSAEGNPASSIYISNDGGVTNQYTMTSASVVHAYRDIVVPAGTTNVTFKFDWKAEGQANQDYFRVWLVPVSLMPVAGTQITAGTGRVQIGTTYNGQNTWQTYNNQNLNISSFAGSTMRVVFEWRNDATLGTNPPAAIDNVMVVICNNTTPTPTATQITHNSATISWPQDVGGASYILRYRPVGAPSWVAIIPVAAAAFPATINSFDLTNLIDTTLYEVEVVAVCNNTEGVYSHIEFTTKCDPTPPSGLSITSVTANTVSVSWNAILPPGLYTIEYREVGATTWTSFTTNNTSYNISGLSPYKNYEIRVASECSFDSGIFTTPIVVTTYPTCEMSPVGLTVSNMTMTQVEVNWFNLPGATYILRWRKVGSQAGWNTVNLNASTYVITGLTEETQYEIQVANVCNGGPQRFTDPYVFTTPGLNYCPMGSTDSASEYISKVTVNGFSNESGASNYTSYIADPLREIVLLQGTAGNTIVINKSWIGTPRNAAVTVWLDFNRNGIFENNERILVSVANTLGSVNGSFFIPEDAYASLTNDKYVVMRVAMSRNSSPEMCSSFEFGEVEDYKVRIMKPNATNLLDSTQINIYPNPVKNILNITRVADGSKYSIYNSIGQLIQSGHVLNNKINVNKLVNGVFVINIEAIDGTVVSKKFIKE